MSLGQEQRRTLEASFAFYRRFSDDERVRFESQVAEFLRTKRFLSDRSEEVDARTKLFVAALACRLSVNLPFERYERVQTIRVLDAMPAEDDDERNERVIGLTTGVLLPTLSFTRKALERAFREDDDGENVVYHEAAHVLDAADGVFDGVPMLVDPRARTTWRVVVADALERLRAAKALNIPTAIKTYGAKTEAELFAVATEAFFERPQKLCNAHPELYELLAGFYAQRP